MHAPSYVAVTDTKRFLGDAAKNQIARNFKNIIVNAKYTDPIVQAGD